MVNIFEFRAKARRLVNKHNVGLILIDYLQLMSGSGDRGSNREQEISNIDLKEEIIEEEIIEEEINITKDSFIPPEPEFIEKEQIKEEVNIDPFTEAEVLNASSYVKEEVIENNEPEIKQQEGIIKRFSAKALFGSSAKKNDNASSNKEELLSSNDDNQLDSDVAEKEELSLSQGISMKTADKNTNEDTLDIPAFLRRQKE